MYGKKTRLRFAEELFWGEAPSSGWVEAALVNANATTSRRVATPKSAVGRWAGTLSAVGRFEAVPTPANAVALGDAALMRDPNGALGSYSIGVSDRAGAWRVSGAIVRKLIARAGIARPALELAFEIAAKTASRVEGFTPEGTYGRPFTFAGSTCQIAGDTVPLREFMLSVDNNLFSGPPRDDGEAGFLTAGLQSVSGYVVIAEDRRDLTDRTPHALTITLPGDGANVVISVGAALFSGAREIRSAIAGAMQVLSFDGVAGAIAGGVTLAVEE